MEKKSKAESWCRNGIMLLLIVAMVFICRKIWRMDFPITKTDFADITLGMATAKNIDIQHLIGWYSLYAVVLSLLFAYLFHRLGYFDKIIKKIKVFESLSIDNDIYFIGFVLIGNILLGNRSWISWTYVLSVLTACIFLYKFNPNADKKSILSTWLTAIISFAIPCAYIAECMETYYIYCILVLLYCIFLLYLCYNAVDEKFLATIHAKLFPFIVASIVSYVMLAFMEVALLRGYAVMDAVIIVPFVMAFVYLCLFEVKIDLDYNKLNFYGAMILLAMSYLPVLGNTQPMNFFEGANSGVSISEFILGTGIPVFNNLDAHLLAGTLPGLIYYSLTGDYIGAVLVPYAWLFIAVLGVISLTYLLKNYFSNQETLILLTLFPWSYLFAFIGGFIVFEVFLYWQKRPGICQNILLMTVFTALSLYKIDYGASFGVALLVCPILYCCGHKRYNILFKYALTFLLWCIVVLCVAHQMALSHNADFMVVMQSFLTAFSSNQNWAYGELGELYNVFWFYLFLPLVTAVLILPYIKRIRNGEESISDWIAIFLYATFIFNIPRILVRHTLVEKIPIAYGIPLILVALLLISRVKKQQAAIFTLIYLIGSVAIIGIGNAGLFGEVVVGAKNMGSIEEYTVNTTSLISSVHANEHSYVKFTDDDAKQIAVYQEFFTSSLDEKETYFDFTNQGLFYAFTKCKNPVYVNQCPAMINGYKGQRQAIDSLKYEKPKFVTMPYRLSGKNSTYYFTINLDGLPNVDRYYLLIDYITENYRPYCAVGDFAIWCLKSEYAALCQQDKANDIEREYLDYTYEPEVNHQHNLGAIPYLWGKCDITDATNKSLTHTESRDYLLASSILGHKGFLMVELEAPYKKDVEIALQGNGISPVKYKFQVQKGFHRYRIHISSDILWYSDKLEKISINDGDVHVKTVSFEELIR